MSSNRARRSPSRGYVRHTRSPPRTRSPRLVADTWVPSNNRVYGRPRSRSPPTLRRRSRSPSIYSRDVSQGYRRTRSPPRRFSPRRDERPRSPRQMVWRSRSPYSEGRPRDTEWSRSTPIRPRDSSPPSQDFRFAKRERFTPSISDRYPRADSPPRRGALREYGPRASVAFRARSPFQKHHERQQESTPKRRSISPSRNTTSGHIITPASDNNSRRPSPSHDKTNLVPFEQRSQSPATEYTPYGRFPKSSGHISPNRERTFQSRYKPSTPIEERPTSSAGKEPHQENHNVSWTATSQHDMNHAHGTFSIPTQPKAYNASLNHTPLSGPSHIPKSLPSQNRGPNISLLSAPTRPRGGLNVRDNSWSGATPRRGTLPAVAQSTPPVSRGSNLMSSGPGTELHQHTFHRQNSIANTGYSRAPRLTNYLAGLCTIIPGGKAFPPYLEFATEKRLAQLETDKTRLFDQSMQKQESKRSEMRNWDRLDRESSISTLRSELAEGQLQRITGGEGGHAGTMF